MPDFPHLIYSKSPAKIRGFKRTRGRDTKKEEQKPEPLPSISQEKKRFLAAKLDAYSSASRNRLKSKTLEVPTNFDLIQINFIVTFDRELENHFFGNYNLSVIERSNFNRNVLFSIGKEDDFQAFSKDITAISSLSEGEDHRNQPFSRLALISDFYLLDSSGRKGVLSGQESIILTICDIMDNPGAKTQLGFMTEYLKSKGIEIIENLKAQNLLFLKNGFSGLDKILADNFDIVRLISSARVSLVKPGTVATSIRTYGFEVVVEEELPIVCVVDTGIQVSVDPLRDLFTGISIDHTGKGAYWDEAGHGTAVSGLIAFGTDFFDLSLKEIPAKARLAVIKAIHQENDDLNIVDLMNDIRELHLS